MRDEEGGECWEMKEKRRKQMSKEDEDNKQTMEIWGILGDNSGG